MLLDTQLYMPAQTSPAEDDFLFTAGSTTAWLKTIPATRFEETGVLLRDYICNANRVNIQSKQRLEAIKKLQPSCRRVIDELHKYLSCQSFPLSPRAHSAYNLQQSLLTELTIAYKIIIIDSIENEKKLNKKTLFNCISNAINYVAEQYLSCVSTYQQLPENLWYEISQIYRIAEHQKFHHKKTKVDLIGDQSSIQQIFKHLCALTLVSFNKLRQGEAEKTCRFLFKNQDLIHFTETADNIKSNSLYLANLATGKQPTYYIPRELPISSENRFIDYHELMKKLDDLSQQPKQPYSHYLQTGDIEPELATRLAGMIDGPNKRNDKRIRSKQSVRAILGLKHIVSTEHQTANNKSNTEKPNDSLGDISLMSTEYTVGSGSSPVFAFDPVHESADIWNLYENKVANSIADEEQPLISSCSDAFNGWHIENYSNSGLCLYYSSLKSQSLRVGDIIAIDKPIINRNKTTLTLGVVRWMQGISTQKHKIGIELINGNYSCAYANSNNNELENTPAILLEKVIDEKTLHTVLLPNVTNMSGQDIMLVENNRIHSVKLGKTLESTGSYSHHQITDITSQPS